MKLINNDEEAIVAIRLGGSIGALGLHPLACHLRGEINLSSYDYIYIDSVVALILLKIVGYKGVRRYRGPSLFVHCLTSLGSDYSQILVGCDDVKFGLIKRRFSPARCDYFNLPFGPVEDLVDRRYVEPLKMLDSQVLWVGIGCPKQDQWIERVKGDFGAVSIIGVGAAFDFASGVLRQPPAVLSRFGLEWSWRLLFDFNRMSRRLYQSITTLWIHRQRVGSEISRLLGS